MKYITTKKNHTIERQKKIALNENMIYNPFKNSIMTAMLLTNILLFMSTQPHNRATCCFDNFLTPRWNVEGVTHMIYCSSDAASGSQRIAAEFFSFLIFDPQLLMCSHTVPISGRFFRFVLIEHPSFVSFDTF